MQASPPTKWKALPECARPAGKARALGASAMYGYQFYTKNVTRGIKVELGTEEVSVDIYLMIEYGTPIQPAAQNVQENVRKAIETMTGLHVVRVDVHVQGVSFEKENKDTQAGLDELHSSVAEVAAQKPAGHVEFEGEPTPAESHNTPDPEPIDVKDENEPEEA